MKDEGVRIRDQVNRLYDGFNRDCGVGANLLSNPIPSYPVNGDRFLRLTINPDLGDGYWDLLRLQPGVLMCVAQGCYQHDYTYVFDPPAELITVRMILSGALECTGFDGQRLTLDQGQINIMKVCPGAHHIKVDGQRNLFSVTLHIQPAYFSEIFDVEPEAVPSLITSVLGYESNMKFAEFSLTRQMSSAILDLTSTQLKGQVRQRYFEAKALELICLLIDVVKQADAVNRVVDGLKRDNFMAVKKAHEILSDCIINPPGVEELARMVGVNRTRLRQDYKKVYGKTISEFVTDQKMLLARDLLNQPQNSINSVALAVGYQYTSNFSNAFRRYYGVSPREIRRLCS